MYISKRAAFMRNVAVASVNGAISLVLLLIAPLGLAAVIFITLSVALSTFGVCWLSDGVITWLLLQPSLRRTIHQPEDLTTWEKSTAIEKPKNRNLDKNQG